LRFFAHRITASTVQNLPIDKGAPLANFLVSCQRAIQAGFQGFRIRSYGFLAVFSGHDISQQADFFALLDGKGHPVPDFGFEFALQTQINGGMHQRTTGCNQKAIRPDPLLQIPQNGQGSFHIRFPDIASIDQPDRKRHVFGKTFHYFVQSRIFPASHIDMQPGTAGRQGEIQGFIQGIEIGVSRIPAFPTTSFSLT
jgi:hypothetical protein